MLSDATGGKCHYHRTELVVGSQSFLVRETRDRTVVGKRVARRGRAWRANEGLAEFGRARLQSCRHVVMETVNRGIVVDKNGAGAAPDGPQPPLNEGGDNMLLRFAFGAVAALTLSGCHRPMPEPTPGASIGAGNPYPVTNYTCAGTRLAVRLMGEKASVSVDGAAAVDLPVKGQSGTTYSNGRQTLIIEQGLASWAVGRATPVACTGN